jgi:ABC-type multidrug transport system ATPase subunit
VRSFFFFVFWMLMFRDLLLKHKAGRTILLTTHFMDEADLLGDRIAIMSEGQLRCLGTPMFLKTRFGVGYHLTMVKTQAVDVNAVEAMITRSIPGAKLSSNVSSELSFVLPRDQTLKFPTLFTELENHRSSLGIQNYGVSVTTMEEVFLRVSSGSLDIPAPESEPQHGRAALLEEKPLPSTGGPLKLRQFHAMLTKR